MGGEVETIGIAEARSALAWWLEAGVDVAVQEEPRDWLKPPAPQPQRKSRANRSAAQRRRSRPTKRWPSFSDWLASSAQLPLASTDRAADHAAWAARMPRSCCSAMRRRSRISQQGSRSAAKSWELARRMLAAIGIPAEQAYSASLSCFHAPGARMSGAEREACAEIARRHIRLAKPKRLLLFGDGPRRRCSASRCRRRAATSTRSRACGQSSTFHPRHLINQPSNKSLAWKDLLLLMEDES